MRRVILLCMVWVCVALSFAADESDQLLVFRNTGEVNLFYASEVDSIVCSYMDADSIVYDVLVSQVFYAKDTTLYVPIEEIDSVTYGSRNAMEYKSDAMPIDAAHLEWIKSYDGTYIYYKPHTPASVIPREGTGLFFPAKESNIFPNGLCAKVEQVNGTIVCVRRAEFNEVFNKLFWAGEMSVEMPSMTRATHSMDINLDCNIADYKDDDVEIELSIEGSTKVVATFVVNPITNYYSGKIKLMENEATFDTYVKLSKGKSINYEEDIFKTGLGTIMGILFPKLSFNAFLKADAEVAVDMEMTRQFNQTFELSCINGVFSNSIVPSNPKNKIDDEMKVDMVLNGSLYFGIGTEFELGLPFEILGGRLKLRFGPECLGQLGFGTLTKLEKKYDASLYANANIEFANKLYLGLYTYNIDFAWGAGEEKEISSMNWIFNKSIFNPFPKYERTRAVAEKGKIKVHTEESGTPKNPKKERPRGVEVSDENGNVLDSIWVNDITPNQSRQSFDTTFVMGTTDIDELKKMKVGPIFDYAGYTIRAEAVNVLADNHIQPVIFSGTNGIVSVLSGYPFIGSKTTETTHYTVGAFLPIVYNDTVFSSSPSTPSTPSSPTFIGGTYIGEQEKSGLIGAWIGDCVQITFIDEMKGTIVRDEESIAFSCKLNYPQNGDIIMNLESGEQLIYTIISIKSDVMVLRDKQKKTIMTLKKQ